MEKTIYCISGLGADEQVFSNLRVEGHRLQHIPWLVPGKKEDISTYAGRMANAIKTPSPVLIGVSFGGMIGIEIAKQLQLNKLFIVSSVKSVAELPAWMKAVGKVQLNKLLPARSYKYAGSIGNRRLGVSTKEEKEMVRQYRRNADPQFVDWAINQVVNWKNDWQPGHLVHIHGDKDKMFPIKRISATHVIPGGTHMMVYNRAAEISRYIAVSVQGK